MHLSKSNTNYLNLNFYCYSASWINIRCKVERYLRQYYKNYIQNNGNEKLTKTNLRKYTKTTQINDKLIMFHFNPIK